MNYRAPDTLVNTDLVIDRLFWIGVYPGLTEEMIRYILEKFGEFVSI
jgi:CDP-6-deoxy-D-xylo-4-hexulose-3-dehydrase